MDSQVTTFPRVLPALVGVLAALLWFPGTSGAQLEEPVFRALPVDPVPRYSNEGYQAPPYANEVYPVAPRAIPVVPSREREGLGLFGRRKDKDRDVERRAPAGGTSDQAVVYPLEQDVIRTAPPGSPVPGYGPAAPGMPQDPGYQSRPTQGYVPGQPVPQAPAYPNANPYPQGTNPYPQGTNPYPQGTNPYPAADPYAPRPAPGAVYPPAGPGMGQEVPPVAPVLEAPSAAMPPPGPAYPDPNPAPFPASPYPQAPVAQTPPAGPAMPPSDAPIFRRDPVPAPAPAPALTETVMAPAPPSLGPEYPPTPMIPESRSVASASTETVAPIFRSTAPAPSPAPTAPETGGAGMAPVPPAAPTPPAPPAPPKAEDEFAHLPFAKPVPGKVGFVLLPDYKGEIDVRGIAPGTPVEIPHPADETKTIQFRVP